MTLAARVLERALQKAGYMPEPAAVPETPPNPGDLIVDTAADNLLAFVNRADAAIAQLLQSSAMSPALEQVRARNRRLARALGACDCFGEDSACGQCGGRGSPGWRLPDRQEFEATVRPTLQKISEYRLSARNSHLHAR
jgi:uncharacterized protein YciW